MKIFQIITLAELGGAQSHVLDLIKGFHCKHELFLATSIEGPMTDAAKELGVPIYLLPFLKREVQPLYDFKAIQTCAELIAKIKPDILHAHSSKAGVVGRWAARGTSTASVFTAHGWGFTPGAPTHRRILAWLMEYLTARHTGKIICVAKSDHDLAKKYRIGKSKQLSVVHYGIPDLPIQADPSRQPPRFVMVARFNEQKDHSTLLKAIALLGDKSPVFDLIGSGPAFEERKRMASDLGINSKVNFLGDRSDVPKLLENTQCFVLCTHYEGLPISILEAMRSGLPVIATNVSGIAEEVGHNVTGLLVRHLDVEALAKAIHDLSSNADRRVEFGKAGRRIFTEKFTAQFMLQSIESIYYELAKSG